MAIKIFSWRYTLRLFIGAFLILSFIPVSVHAFSDEPAPPPNISDEPPPPPPHEDTDEPNEEIEKPTVPPPNEEIEKPTVPPPLDQRENIGPPADETPVGNIEASPGGTDTTDLVEPTPTIEAGPDINQPDFQESTGEAEGETAVEIPGETGQEATPTTTEETPRDGGQTTSEPSLNPPVEPPSGEFGFSAPVTDAVNQTGIDIIQQLSSTGDLGTSGGEFGGEGGGGDTITDSITILLTGSSIDSTNFNVLVQGLLQILGAPSREVAEQLVRSLLGLLKDGKVDPRRLWAAINAYNAFIEASSPEFLENPPIELVMIRAILSDLVEAAIAADIRSRN